jgi:hypothetical protein
MLVYKFYMNSIRRRPPNTSFAFASPALPSNCFLQADNSVHCLSSDGKVVGTGKTVSEAQTQLKIKQSKSTTHPSSMVTHHVANPDKHPSIKHVTHSVSKVTPVSKPIEKMTVTNPLDQVGKSVTDTVSGVQKGLASIGDTIFGVKSKTDKTADQNKIAPTVLKDTKNDTPSFTPAVVKKITPAHPATITPLNNTITTPAPVSPFLQTALDNGKALSQAPATTTTTAPTVNAPAGDTTQPPAPPGQGLLGGNNMLLIGGIVVVGLVLILAVR